MLSVKQGSIKDHFLSLWYDLNWNWTPASRTIGEHPTHLAKRKKKRKKKERNLKYKKKERKKESMKGKKEKKK